MQLIQSVQSVTRWDPLVGDSRCDTEGDCASSKASMTWPTGPRWLSLTCWLQQRRFQSVEVTISMMMKKSNKPRNSFLTRRITNCWQVQTRDMIATIRHAPAMLTKKPSRALARQQLQNLHQPQPLHFLQSWLELTRVSKSFNITPKYDSGFKAAYYLIRLPAKTKNVWNKHVVKRLSVFWLLSWGPERR